MSDNDSDAPEEFSVQQVSSTEAFSEILKTWHFRSNFSEFIVSRECNKTKS